MRPHLPLYRARRALKLVVRANVRRDKAPVLLQLREELEELKVLLRLGQDVKAFPNFNSFEHAITQVVEIAKQKLVGRGCILRLPCVILIFVRTDTLRAFAAD